MQQVKTGNYVLRVVLKPSTNFDVVCDLSTAQKAVDDFITGSFPERMMWESVEGCRVACVSADIIAVLYADEVVQVPDGVNIPQQGRPSQQGPKIVPPQKKPGNAPGGW